MEVVCRGDERGEGLLYMCDRLKALGSVVSWIGYQKDGELLDLCGEDFGQVISDYAKAMYETIDEVWPVINEYFQNGGVSLLFRLKAVQKEMQRDDPSLGWKLHKVEEALTETNQFLGREVKDIIDVQKDLEGWRNLLKKGLAEQNGGVKAQGGSRNQEDSYVDKRETR